MNRNGQVFYHGFSTLLGHSALIFRKRPFAIIKVLLPCDDLRMLKKKVKEASKDRSDAHQIVRKLSDSIIEYLNGKPLKVPWEYLDLERFTELQKAVLTAVADIPYAEVRTYKEIAEAVGRPAAYRFVGTTLGKNPFPLLIPCHRVIKSDYSIGQFGGGTDLKKRLIGFEKNQFSNSSV